MVQWLSRDAFCLCSGLVGGSGWGGILRSRADFGTAPASFFQALSLHFCVDTIDRLAASFQANYDACNAKNWGGFRVRTCQNETSTTNDGLQTATPQRLVASNHLGRKRSQCRVIAACPVHVCRRGCLVLNSPSPIPVHT